MSIGRRARAFWAAVVGVTSMVVSAGCASLPTSGEPHEFAIEAPQREPLRQYGSAPQAGSSPERLVEDFLLASSAGTYDDYATARLYLTPDASVAWHPGEQVIIFPSDSSPTPEVLHEGGAAAEVALTMQTIGSVDSAGKLDATGVGGTMSATFDLERNSDGEWRISELDSGLVLSQSAFLNAYQATNLYFPSADLSALVPDPRWYPRTRVASYLVQGLIDGPAESIAPAVNGGIAANLSLPTAGVDVKDRNASVVLEGAAGTSEVDKGALYWSVYATLRQLAAVQTIAIRLNGVVLTEDLMPKEPDYRMDRVTGLEDGAVVVGTSTLATVIADAEAAGEGAEEPAVGPLATSPSAWINPILSTARIVETNADGTNNEPRIVNIQDPGAPSIDRWGGVWLSSGEGDGSIHVVPLQGNVQEVNVGRDGHPKVVTVSPDGARAAILLDLGGSAEVVIAAVVRDADTGAYSLENPYVATQISSEPTDLTWVGEATIAVLLNGRTAETAVQVYPLGGWATTMSAPEGISRITASNTVGSMIVQTPESIGFQRVGAAWMELPGVLNQISYAG